MCTPYLESNSVDENGEDRFDLLLKKQAENFVINDRFFPDFVIIDDFKGAICDSLQEYSQNIAELQTEMEGAYDDARAIREEIQKFKSRHILAKASDKCAMCKGFLLTRPFHLFVCGHKFHTECLIAGVLKLTQQ